MSLTKTLQAGKSNIPLKEFPVEGETVDYLYNPEGIEINYGYDSQGRYRVAYGALGSNNNNSEFVFGGKVYSSGLHNINLNRTLTNGEEIVLTWYDGHQLVLYGENGYLETIPNSEINNPHSEGLYELNLKEKEIEGVVCQYYEYDLTEDTQIIPNKKYYSYTSMTKVKKINGGSYNEIGKWADESGNSEYTALLFDDNINTKRFDKIKVKTFEEF